MKKTVLLVLINLSALQLFAQSNPVISNPDLHVNSTPHIVYKVDTILYLTAKYPVPKRSTVAQMLKVLEGFEVADDSSVTHQGQAVKKIKINGKLYEGLEIKQAIKKLPADIVEDIEMIDDYGEKALLIGIKDGDPDKLLNINIKKGKAAQLKKLLIGMHVNPNSYIYCPMVKR
jgi:hypothetical protein